MINLKQTIKLSAISLALLTSINASADIVHLDDVIIDGSACIGLDCVNGESFGFDTIRIKENNLRIRAVDTSSTSSFPTGDWQISFNDSANGGINRFSVDDIDGGRTPFTIEANAPSHSLYVDDGGRLGLGTSTPVVDVHIKSGNTPTLRLEQDGSSGFTPQTWDVAGNEANFFVRDATNGSTLPFRIFPGAPSNALNIEASTGDIGLNTTSPTSPFHVVDGETGTTATATIENNGANTNAILLALVNEGNSYIQMTNTTGGADVQDWFLGARNDGDLTMTNSFNSDRHFELDKNGNLTVSGTVSGASSVTLKENFTSIMPAQILDAISGMAISKWNYIKDGEAIQHIGPTAEDFHEAFGLNGNRTDRISYTDIAGIALSSIKALKSESEELDRQLKDRDVKIEKLQNRLDKIEALIATQNQ